MGSPATAPIVQHVTFSHPHAPNGCAMLVGVEVRVLNQELFCGSSQGRRGGNGRHNRMGTLVMCLPKGYDKGMHSQQPNFPPQSSLRITSRCTRRKLPLSISPSGVGPYESTASQHGQPPIQDSTCCYEERRTEATDEPGVFRVNRRAESLPKAWKSGCGE